jgi:hypothetical protein
MIYKHETSFLLILAFEASGSLWLDFHQNSRASKASMLYVLILPEDGKTCHAPFEMV